MGSELIWEELHVRSPSGHFDRHVKVENMQWHRRCPVYFYSTYSSCNVNICKALRNILGTAVHS